MKILWISNILLPDVANYLHVPVSFGGGWMYSSLKAMRGRGSDNEFGVLSFSNTIDELFEKVIDGVTYFIMPEYSLNNQDANNEKAKYIADTFFPDIVHIHGTEQQDAYYFFLANQNLKYVVSIQGLVSVYASYYLSSMNLWRLIKYTSIYEIVKKISIFHGKSSYERKGKTEVKYIEAIENIIGRTEWDRAHTWAINPKARYFFCNETLRPAFYNKRWCYDNCERHTIFVSQAKNPIKGFHQLVKALPLILRDFPDTKVIVGSSLDIAPKTIKDKIKMGSYAKYIRYLIKKTGTQGHFEFKYGLSESEMCDNYLKCNVFVSASAIENSPNSVGEAQLLGVPTISSYVGGVGDMIIHNETGYYYRYDEPQLLAYLVNKIFSNDYNPNITVNAQGEAVKRHDPNVNASRLLEIYKQIKAY